LICHDISLAPNIQGVCGGWGEERKKEKNYTNLK
jgi:hypothetical protein